MTLLYTDRAKDDLETAFLWYERQQQGLGQGFLDSVETAIQQIIANPNAQPLYHEPIRGCLIRRFPFTLFYSIEAEGLIIHSVFHHRLDTRKRP
ncbi:type II toxin-antitoxin system RelE/ParE family toxin [Saccharospirillum mangrovi]|uniref:type II toxin-antitoxin system RelE/ParE family toxin n=1 Tax=Saccharospirillum mangrovi TaxID=2161747 RepID=UPI000D3B63B1|nr:type II toxin-antitoxin system RelE/ParE family toxin [Saccharospirillum mangrovi]